MESPELRALLADTLHHERLATAAACRPLTSDPGRGAEHETRQLARSIQTAVLLLAGTLLRSLTN